VSTPEVLVLRDHPTLAAAAAARLVTSLVEVLADGGHAHLALTGGTIGIDTLAALAASTGVDAVDWDRVHVWWSDERFLPSGDPDRNETQAREALLDRIPLRPEHVHAMPPSDGEWGDDVDAAAAGYADELAAAATSEDHGPVPQFDVLLLGMGPDGHVASLFPENPALHDERPVCGVRGSPKPPPVRISFTFGTITRAREVWLVVSGLDKAPAVEMALAGAGQMQVPAAAVRGTRRTLALLDQDAASRLPRDLWRAASP
jgi:6-phosphogluconolactonase